MVITNATLTNEDGSQQWQWWGQATVVETETAAGAHNNQPTNGSNMAAETASAALAVAMAAAVAVAGVTMAMVVMSTAQTVAAVCEIYIKKG